MIRLSYVSFRHARYVFGGGLNINGDQSDSLRITHSHFREIGGDIFRASIYGYSGATMVIKNNTFADFEDYFMKESVRLYGDGTLLEIDANEFVDPHNNLMDWNSFRVQEVGPKILFTNNQSTSNSRYSLRLMAIVPRKTRSLLRTTS